ncbi:small conductance mechanosensitive channel [Anseongella ginsenosidimutans]|uniref:Small conductance mechanosensitive channel n=1 Tax=Anseongella ginsenosidimutans TaxID=496056 RepID=A0A4R3KY08_9SPHI|nr:mechanosensitive ion channel domain-containing protein [Anseongella ginsenosidimutans]QEC51541.1 mechanosensitive ion channel [Anseongella ginsenosidimutans]TCS88862.1 small conductance mechanosensitive channel [Anseongella ginsenosidimutans]
MNETTDNISNYFFNFLYTRGPGILLAIVTLVAGVILIKYLMRGINKRMEKRRVDPSLIGFLSSLANFVLYILLFMSVARMIGIATTSFLTLIGAAGLAIGLALQGSLSNFAGGVLILLFKPFRVGEYISSTSEASGTVKKIDILYTTLTTPGNEEVYAPNGPLANSVITNYSRNGMRRLDFNIGIAYDSDIRKARELMLEIFNSDPRVRKEPAAPIVVLNQLADSSVNLIGRIWVGKDDYWDVFFEGQETIKETLEANGISLPFPQREVIIRNETQQGTGSLGSRSSGTSPS